MDAERTNGLTFVIGSVLVSVFSHFGADVG